jgi:tetratricopeptide (TPR) repeat protein
MSERASAAAKGEEGSLIQVHLVLAELALEAGDAKTALDETERALAVAPRHGAVLLARGDAFALANDLEGALEAYGKALTTQLANAGGPEDRIKAARRALADKALPPPRSKAGRKTPTTRSRPYAAGLDLDLI